MPYNYIAETKSFANCLSQLEHVSSIALDLEFDKNRYAYGFNLCLVQIYTGQHCFLIDPFSEEIDIQLLFPVLENNAIQKIVFAFGEDLRLLHSLGCFPKNIFDISLAAKLLNYPPGSLAALLDEVLNLEINKSSQNSNWLKRPLSDDQKNYAALDVIHLLDLQKALVKEAVAKNKIDWIDQENAAFDLLSYAGIENNNFIKKKDKNGLSEFNWHLFKELLTLRERVAKKTGRPSYQVFDKEMLKKIAQHPDKINEWENRKGIYKPLKSKLFQAEFAKILADAVTSNLSKTKPANKPLSREESLRHQRERSRAEGMKVKYFKPIQKEIIDAHGEHAATIILGNKIITAIISGNLDKMKEYQLELISGFAKQLKLDLSSFFPKQKAEEIVNINKD